MRATGYHYSTIPGGLKRKKISPNFSILKHQSHSQLNMPRGGHDGHRPSGIRPFHVDPWTSHPTTDTFDLYDSSSDDHYRSSSTLHRRSHRPSRYQHPRDNADSRSDGPRSQDVKCSIPSPNEHYHHTDHPDTDIADDQEPNKFYEASANRHDHESLVKPLRETTLSPKRSTNSCSPPHHDRCHRACSQTFMNHHAVNNGSTSSAGPQPVAFEAAVKRLDKIIINAVEFFKSFQQSFEREILHLVTYANRNTIKSVWKDKILRNEKYLDQAKDGTREQVEGEEGADTANSTENNSGSDSQRKSHLVTFGEYRSELKRNVVILLKCQILRPRLRGGVDFHDHDEPGNDDYLDSVDIRNLAKYHSAHNLRKSVIHFQRNLFPLLDRIGHDHGYMESALIELKNLSDLFHNHSDAWEDSRA